MGEVYRARDTKLGREVAIKVLPEALAGDAEYLVRFEREAKMLASLDHSNIAAIYEFIGLEAGNNGVHHFLVMQLVEGETLADRIGRGPLPADEAIGVFSQIAEGLEAAHARGIVHRDLKPANVKVTHEGRVKILDFGIAKSTEGFATPGASSPRPSTPSGSGGATKPMSTTPSVFATGPGGFIGTPHYMSPEQARGRPVDKRTDIWAWGVCLFEALTGFPPFDGASATDLVAAIVRDEPNLGRLPTGTPAHLHALLSRCLEKEPKLRLRDIGEAWYALNHPLKPETGGACASAEREVTRFTVSFPANHYLSTTFSPLAISPDGQAIACALTYEGKQQLYIRPMDALDFRPVPGTDRARAPFFSFDGKWLGFFQRRAIKAVPAAGGTIRTIVECESTPVNGVWTPEDTIIWGELNSGLQMIKPDGTGRKTITASDKETGEQWHTPFCTVGKQGWILANVVSGLARSRLEFISTHTGERQKSTSTRTPGCTWIPAIWCSAG